MKITKARFCAILSITYFFFAALPIAEKVACAQPYVVEVEPSPPVRSLDAPLQAVGSIPDYLTGKVVYASTINTWPFQRHLVAGGLPQKELNNGIELSKYVLSESKNSSAWLFYPQFSPDGRHLLFKWGEPFERYIGHNLYLLDLSSRKVKLLANLTYQFALWSPDSRYIAYIRGGDADGNTTSEKLRLYVFDRTTNTENFIVENDGIRNSVSWTPQNTILYSIVADGDKIPVSRLDIYESSVDGKNRKLLIKNGYRAICSSDGKKIAFFGSENVEKATLLTSNWWNNPNNSAMMVAERNGSNRIVLGREDKSYPTLRWTKNDKSILSIKTTVVGKGANGEISVWDLDTKKRQILSTIRAEDVEVLPREETFPFFKVLELSGEGNFLPIIVTEFRASDSVLYTRLETLKFVNVTDGEVYSSIELKGAFGLDWSAAS